MKMFSLFCIWKRFSSLILLWFNTKTEHETNTNRIINKSIILGALLNTFTVVYDYYHLLLSHTLPCCHPLHLKCFMTVIKMLYDHVLFYFFFISIIVIFIIIGWWFFFSSFIFFVAAAVFLEYLGCVHMRRNEKKEYIPPIYIFCIILSFLWKKEYVFIFCVLYVVFCVVALEKLCFSKCLPLVFISMCNVYVGQHTFFFYVYVFLFFVGFYFYPLILSEI